MSSPLDIQKNRYKFFSVAAIGVFMATLDGSIVNVSLPTIAGEFGCTINQIAWVVLSYTLTLVSLLMMFGAWTIVQAIGSSMFQAVGIGLVSRVFPEKERGKGIGMMVMMVSAGLMTGPPLGGVLVDFFPWQSIFVINIPIGIIGLVFTYRYIKLLPKATITRPMRLGGGLAISTAIFCWTLGLSFISDYGLANFRVWGLLGLAAVAFVYFVKRESSPETALIGMDLFRNKRFSKAVLASILVFVSMAGAFILIPFYLEQVREFEPRKVGLFLITFPVIMFIVAPLAGRLFDRIGARLLTVAGVVVLTVGMYLVAHFESTTRDIYIILSVAVMAIGSAIFNTPNSSDIMNSVTEKQRAISSGIISTSRNIGMSTGVALGTALFAYFQLILSNSHSETEMFVMSFQRVMYAGMGIALLTLPLCFGRHSQPVSAEM
jgi:MFS family permease